MLDVSKVFLFSNVTHILYFVYTSLIVLILIVSLVYKYESLMTSNVILMWNKANNFDDKHKLTSLNWSNHEGTVKVI